MDGTGGFPRRLSTARRRLRDALSVAGSSVVDVKRSTQTPRVEAMAGTDREKALDAALAQIERQFGKGAVMRLGERPNEPIEVIPTGSTALDVALGVGGLPRGRVVEVYGPESSGKTTLTLHAVANAQKAGGQVAFVDAEHALDPEYAKKLGVDIDNLLVSQPDSGEQALEIAEMLVKSNSVDVIVVDSVAALTPKAEIEGEMGDTHVGLQARLMSQAMRKLTAIIGKSKCALIFINQIRMKIGVMFGNPETTPGGKALKFYSSVRIDIRRLSTITDTSGAIGSRVRARVVKNKIAPPFRETEFDIMFDSGISYEGDLLDLALAGDIIERSGAWLNYGKIRLGQGRENAKKYLIDYPEVRNELKDKVLSTKGLLSTSTSKAKAESEDPVEAEA
jgi:recombination protein RecA